MCCPLETEVFRRTRRGRWIYEKVVCGCTEQGVGEVPLELNGIKFNIEGKREYQGEGYYIKGVLKEKRLFENQLKSQNGSLRRIIIPSRYRCPKKKDKTKT